MQTTLIDAIEADPAVDPDHFRIPWRKVPRHREPEGRGDLTTPSWPRCVQRHDSLTEIAAALRASQ